MCLESIETEVELKIRASIKKTFPCWKMLWQDNTTEFGHYSREPRLMRGNTYKAKMCSWMRSRLRYKPGFHALLRRKDALMYKETSLKERGNCKIVKFWAENKNITYVGEQKDAICVVLSEITRK